MQIRYLAPFANLPRLPPHVELIRFRKNSDFIDIGNFEVGIMPDSFATAVFTKLVSMLSRMSRHWSVLVAPDVSGHDHFGT